MARKVAIGADSFEDIRENGYFLVDKTGFIGRWWREGDKVTLVCRPRRFGKTLALSMVERFLTNLRGREGTGRLFAGLEVSSDPRMMALMGTVPVVSLSFADVKRTSYDGARQRMCRLLRIAVKAHSYLLDSKEIDADDKLFLSKVTDDMGDEVAMTCLGELCRMLHAHWGVRPVVLLDEYDTPLVEAWTGGYWDEMASFVRGLFNSTFKTNPSLGRALVTGVTRVAQESIFSDMNNPNVVTSTIPLYETDFGFTQAEVDSALEEYGLSGRVQDVELWYDGYSFGKSRGVYNPWSVVNCLKYARLGVWWVSTSSNSLVSEVVRAHPRVMGLLESLISGGNAEIMVDEQVSFRDLGRRPGTVWPLLLAAGYLTYDVGPVVNGSYVNGGLLSLSVPNLEVKEMFKRLVRDWFEPSAPALGTLPRALLEGDEGAAQERLAEIAARCVSAFDTGVRPSARAHPERFWHGLVLGMCVELLDAGYEVRSNIESGLGRLDATLVPQGTDGAACVLEFKVADGASERALEGACAAALAQIRDNRYDEAIVARGVAPGRIRHFGIAFSGKRVLVRVGSRESVPDANGTGGRL